jgi:hypothetical protein
LLLADHEFAPRSVTVFASASIASVIAPGLKSIALSR